MGNVSLAKTAGTNTCLQIINGRAKHEYPSNANGSTTHDGDIIIHLTGSPSETEANNILTAIALPTCTSSLLDITSNVGTYIVNDVISIVADPDNKKFVEVVVGIDDTTGVLEMFALEKTTGEYPGVPAGKTNLVKLKEFSVPAAGTALTETINYIS